MSEQKIITSISVITDSENNYDKIGDIQGGGFDDNWLKEHIKKNGTHQLLETLCWMNYQIWQKVREINVEKDFEETYATDKKNIEIGKEYFVDVGSLSPIKVRTLSFEENGIKCQYLDLPYLKTEIIPIELF